MSISCYSTESVIEVIMAVIMVIVVISVFIRSYVNGKSENGKGSGIGARIIQFTCVTLIIPCIIILGIEKILQGETIATIIGGLVGFVLSGISDYDGNRKKDNEKPSK